MTNTKDNMRNTELLVNPNVETQKKEKTIKKVSHYFVVAILLLLSFIGYIFGFSTSSNLALGNKEYIGILNTENHSQFNFGDLCVVQRLDNVSTLKKNDTVFFSIKGEVYSAKVVSISTETIVVNLDNQEILVAVNNINGVLVGNVAVLGVIIGFVFSYYGGIIFSLILFIYLSLHTMRRINYENTEKGKQLRDKYLAEKKAFKKKTKEKAKLLAKDKFELLQLIDKDVVCSLSNIKQKAKNKNEYELYNLIVDEAHECFMAEKSLTKQQRITLTIIVELSVCFNRITLDVEYKIVDLLIKSKLLNFNCLQFLEHSKRLITKGTEESLYNLGSILFVMLSRDKTLCSKEISQIVSIYGKELENRKYEKDLRCCILYEKLKEFKIKM